MILDQANMILYDDEIFLKKNKKNQNLNKLIQRNIPRHPILGPVRLESHRELMNKEHEQEEAIV